MLKLNHKELLVYKESILFVSEVYKLSLKFPDAEKFGLVSQIKRAAVSVISNIAEGAARGSINERKRFFEISRSSLVEVDTQLEIAEKLGFLTEEEILYAYTLLENIYIKLSAMIKKLSN